jgi:hypothetical protein
VTDIFVFGSNKLGIHGAGAAKEAHRYYGAVYGCGEGLRGQCYAIPTKKTPYVSLTLIEVKPAVDRFKLFALEHPQYEFHLTRVGCGLAGFTDEEIAPLFHGCPKNVHLPDRWLGLI